MTTLRVVPTPATPARRLWSRTVPVTLVVALVGSAAPTATAGGGESEPIVGVAVSQSDPTGDYRWWPAPGDPEGASAPAALRSIDVRRMLYVADFDERTFTVRFSVRRVLPQSGPSQRFRATVGNRRVQVAIVARSRGSVAAHGIQGDDQWRCDVTGHLDRRRDRVRVTVPLGCFHGARSVRARSLATVATDGAGSVDRTRRTSLMPLTRAG